MPTVWKWLRRKFGKVLKKNFFDTTEHYGASRLDPTSSPKHLSTLASLQADRGHTRSLGPSSLQHKLHWFRSQTCPRYGFSGRTNRTPYVLPFLHNGDDWTCLSTSTSTLGPNVKEWQPLIGQSEAQESLRLANTWHPALLTFLKAQQLSPKSTFTRHPVCRLHRPADHSHMGPCQPPILAQSSKDELIESRGLNKFGRRSLKPLFCLANSTAFSEDSEHKKCAGCF